MFRTSCARHFREVLLLGLNSLSFLFTLSFYYDFHSYLLLISDHYEATVALLMSHQMIGKEITSCLARAVV